MPTRRPLPRGRGEPFRAETEPPRRPALFLAPQPYRQRRLIDAARAVPLFGAFLVLAVPLLIPRGVEGTTTSLLVFLLLVWIGMVIAAALIARFLRGAMPEARDGDR